MIIHPRKPIYNKTIAQLVRGANALVGAINVKDFGAQGVKTGDDTQAIRDAIVALRAAISTANATVTASPFLYFPPGVYPVEDTLNLTAITTKTWGLVGPGAIILGKCAGKPVLDLMASRYFKIQDLSIVGDSVESPSIGLQCGRPGSSVSTGEFILDRTQFFGTFTRSAMYALAPEVVEYNHCKFWNNHSSANSFCLICDMGNAENITSEFVSVAITPGTALSFNDSLFLSCDFRKGVSGPCILYQSGATTPSFNGHKYVRCYGAAFSDEIFRFTNCRGGNSIHIEMHCEASTLKRCISIDNTNPTGTINFRDFRFSDYAPQASESFIDLTGGSRQVVMDNATMWFGAPSHDVPIFGANADSSKLKINGSLGWDGAQGNTFDISKASFTGFLNVRGAIMGQFPTSVAGLLPGTIWADEGTMKIA